MARLLKNGHELLRVVWLPDGQLAGSSDPLAAPVELSPASKATAEITRKTRPMYTQPEAQTHISAAAPSAVLMDYHVPLFRGDDYLGDLVATYQTSALLDEMVPWWFAQDNQVSLVDRDDKVLARARRGRSGHGVYTHKRALDLPGASVTLVTDSVKSEPSCCPTCWSAR
jgi:two-component system sensor histidine kinase DctS